MTMTNFKAELLVRARLAPPDFWTAGQGCSRATHTTRCGSAIVRLLASTWPCTTAAEITVPHQHCGLVADLW